MHIRLYNEQAAAGYRQVTLQVIVDKMRGQEADLITNDMIDRILTCLGDNGYWVRQFNHERIINSRFGDNMFRSGDCFLMGDFTPDETDERYRKDTNNLDIQVYFKGSDECIEFDIFKSTDDWFFVRVWSQGMVDSYSNPPLPWITYMGDPMYFICDELPGVMALVKDCQTDSGPVR
jgi:hypothetical protein